MVLRVITIAAIVAAGHTVAAQTPVAVQIAPEAKHQVQVFEGSLRAAVEKAQVDMLKRAQEVVPGIGLEPEDDTRVYSMILPEGYTFMVDVPAIAPTNLMMFDLYQRMPGTNRPSNVANPVPPASTGPPINPGREYSEFTRLSLVDTMLDNALALPLKEGQRLTVVVGTPGGARTGQIAEVPRKLYLTLKSEDLVALRENRINREEARKRIVEERY